MNHFNQIHKKIKTLDELSKEIIDIKSKGRRVVFTNGCFDILHKGHVQYLSLAADLGDVLIVAVNTDESVKRQGKGDDRPVNNLDAREFVLAALQMIDYVLPFNEDTPEKLIHVLTPNILVKGGDYNPAETNPNSKKYIVGREHVLKNGGDVKVIDLVDGFSTTGIINKLKK